MLVNIEASAKGELIADGLWLQLSSRLVLITHGSTGL